MPYLLLILALIGNNTYGNDFEYGGWLSYTYIDDRDSNYMLNSHPEIGGYAAYSIDNNTSINGMAYYDYILESTRVGYLYAKTNINVLSHPLTIEAGFLRAKRGVWGDYLIDPSTKPISLQGGSIYPVRYESDTSSGPGIRISGKINNSFGYSFLVGNNYSHDAESFIKHTYIQNEPINKDFGSIFISSFNYRISQGYNLTIGYSKGELSKDINDLERWIIGTDIQKGKWGFSIEYQEVKLDGLVDFSNTMMYYLPTQNITTTFKDIFTYVTYEMDSNISFYTSYSNAKKDKNLNKYTELSLLKNALTSGMPVQPNPAIISVMMDEGKYESFSFGMIYNFTPTLSSRIEGTYVKSSGIERLFNVKEGTIRPKETVYFGLTITQKF